VVDACYLPSSAREDIAQIRQWTDKPVRYLLNTHWHYDHTMGNAAYRDAFPDLRIVAHTETQKQIAGYNPGWFARYPDRGKLFQTAIDSGKDSAGRTLSPSEIDEYKTALKGLEPVGREYQASAPRLAALAPDTAFEQELRVDLGGREVRLAFSVAATRPATPRVPAEGAHPGQRGPGGTRSRTSAADTRRSFLRPCAARASWIR
jgi:glyoxylase-like metal-dependent hydrolase (beta-lactamase superfamily II)